MLVRDACSKPPIMTRSHNLHVGNIRRVVGVIASYHKRVALFLIWFLQVVRLLAFLWLSFLSFM